MNNINQAKTYEKEGQGMMSGGGGGAKTMAEKQMESKAGGTKMGQDVSKTTKMMNKLKGMVGK